MKKIIHRAEDRGAAEHGWLHTKFSFSFSEYYDPEKMGFGLLRVLNDDIVEPGKGFGMHPHNNMEIITIILEGELQHKDSMGNGSVIKKNEVQVMSAGSGILHSEFNPSGTEKVNLLQIWIYPKEKNIKPRYDQKKFDPSERENKIQTVVSGISKNGALYIHQDASLSLLNLEKDKSLKYEIHKKGNAVYLFLIDGQVQLDDEELFRRDAAGLSGTDEISILAKEKSDILIIEVPMDNER
ncbi:MAG: pirin family protein [Ignavibacteriales bacterium]|nr:MAG: pirin family protein [Ignavibacteriales bacterium]